jgi:hypothetical protein
VGPITGVDCNLILCGLKSRLQNMYQPYARTDFFHQPGTRNLSSGS